MIQSNERKEGKRENEKKLELHIRERLHMFFLVHAQGLYIFFLLLDR